MNKLSSLGLFWLRQMSIKIHAIFTGESETWAEEIKAVFAEYNIDTAEILDAEAYIPDPSDEDGWPEWYGGFIEDLNSTSVETVEDVENKIILFAEMIDRRTGDLKITAPDRMSESDYTLHNIPTGVSSII